MEKESNITLGGTIILLALFLQRYIFGQRYTPSSVYKKGIKQNQKKPLETTLSPGLLQVNAEHTRAGGN